MTATFAHLGLPDSLIRKLSQRGITEPFPVQAVAIPDALAGWDVCGKAPTGSGKTLAFGLPLLANLGRAATNRPAALILAPTRELAEQIKSELAPLAEAINRTVFAVYGGVGYGAQKSAVRRGAEVIVATPGRLEDLIEQRAVDLSETGVVVVDEADRMADMGFLPAVRRILDRTPAQRQTLLFSATLDGDVAVLSRDYQRDPVRHEAEAIEPKTTDARHHFWLVQHHDRVQHTADVIAAEGRSIVFTRTRHGADRLAKQLTKMDIGAVAMHGGRSQPQRHRALQAFSSGRAHALIATDVAARGIHIDDVASVIHFDPPADSKDYLHRSGRTARAGAGGTVVSLVTDEQQRAVRRLQRDLDLHAPIVAPGLDELEDGGRRTTHARPRADVAARAKHLDTPRKRLMVPGQNQSARTGSAGQSIYVANLPWDATAEDIEDLFGRYGHVHEATIITDRRTGRSRGFGFVAMPSRAAATAIAALHRSTLNGRNLTVRPARPKRHRH